MRSPGSFTCRYNDSVRRRLLNLLTVLSLMLCVAACVLWVRARIFQGQDEVSWDAGRSVGGVLSAGGTLFFYHRTWDRRWWPLRPLMSFSRESHDLTAVLPWPGPGPGFGLVRADGASVLGASAGRSRGRTAASEPPASAAPAYAASAGMTCVPNQAGARSAGRSRRPFLPGSLPLRTFAFRLSYLAISN
jgi:hypothetical protein